MLHEPVNVIMRTGSLGRDKVRRTDGKEHRYHRSRYCAFLRNAAGEFSAIFPVNDRERQ